MLRLAVVAALGGVAVSLGWAVSLGVAPDAPAVDYQLDVRPILSDICYRCHGPNEESREAELRLDLKENVFAENEYSGLIAVVPGKPDESELFARVSSDEPYMRMPPDDSGRTLTPEQIDLFRRWIEQGAAWDEHWSFVAPERPPLPEVQDAAWPRGEIDRFILARLEAAGLRPSPEADRATLLRRVTFDLTGLPPTPEEADAFLADDSPDAYEKAVDRLLASPRYGEHMARFWLDAARYGDTHGLHLDNYREMWPYRDWVVEALNRNMPFDEFTTWQLAGDLLDDPTLEMLVATGFNRCNVTTNEGGVIVEEVFVRNVADRVATTGTVFMGLSMDCARCHDHMYDPVTAADFYSMFAFFNSIDGGPMDGNRKDHAPVAQVPSAEQSERRQSLREQLAAAEQAIRDAVAAVEYEEPAAETPAEPVESTEEGAPPAEETPEDGEIGTGSFCAKHPKGRPGQTYLSRFRDGTPEHTEVETADETPEEGANEPEPIEHRSLRAWEEQQRQAEDSKLPKDILGIIRLEPGERNDAQRQKVRDYYIEHVYAGARPVIEPLQKRRDALRQELDTLEKQIPTTLVFRERSQPKPAFILERGEYDQPKDAVERATPAFLPPMRDDMPKNRLGFAQWLLDPGHPLTARVTVNRFWQQVFGTGIVKTAEDFGSQGEPPSHPKLLDWLAVDFRENGWDVKRLMRQLVTSAAYRQASAVSPELLARDPENRLLARGPRFRLDAEMLRDQALAVGGLLVETMGGPGVKPPQPEGLWEAVGYVGSDTAKFTPDRGPEKVHRRTLYTFFKRTAPPPQLSTFDAPTREACTVRRERTNTPLQALLLLNDPQFVECARALAERTMQEVDGPPEARAAALFRRAVLRQPDEAEREELVGLYQSQLEVYRQDAEAAKRLIAVGELPPDANLDPAELAAWTIVANTVLNLDEVLCKN